MHHPQPAPKPLVPLPPPKTVEDEEALEMSIDFVHYELPAVRFALDACAAQFVPRIVQDNQQRTVASTTFMHPHVSTLLRRELCRAS